MAIEAKRGCGYRKVGGKYLIGGNWGEDCHRLPFLLDVCPTCKNGIKQSRGWTWVDGKTLFAPACPSNLTHCLSCPICQGEPLKEAGLLWIGEKFYPTPQHFAHEGLKQGISRRISAIPRGFKLGETWVLLAHSKAVKVDGNLMPGIFWAFKPTRIEELITESQATAEKLEELAKRSITPVIVPDDDRDHQGSVYDRSVQEQK